MVSTRVVPSTLVGWPLLLSYLGEAGWVPLNEDRRNAWPAGSEDPYGVDTIALDSPWVRVEGHRLKLGHGYDLGVVGNLEGVPHVKPLRASRNHALVAPIAAGTPPQEMTCMLDASSADLWLPSVRCESCALDQKDESGFFHAARSSSFRPEVDMTWFGPAPRALRVVYGGGSAAGFVVNDTVDFGKVEVPQQTFLLAEEGGVDARRERAWDGVCGLGRRGPEPGGKPLFERLKDLDMREMYVLSPIRGRRGHTEVAHLAVGTIPVELAAPGYVAWIPTVTPAGREGERRGAAWMAQAKVSLDGGVAGAFAPRTVRALLETGTSYLLVPQFTYLHFVRQLFPDSAFDRYCGVDEHAGGAIICHCDIRLVQSPQITFSFVDQDGHQRPFTISPEDLFEESSHLREGSGGSEKKVCVFQVQPRPESTDVAGYFGVLGTPHEGPSDSFGPGIVGASPFSGLPFGLGGLLGQIQGRDPGPGLRPPAMWPAVPMPDPVPAVLGARAAAQATRGDGDAANTPPDQLQQILAGLGSLNASTDPLSQILQSLAHLAGDSVVKEVVVETLGDGSRCETEIVRAANGTVLSRHTNFIDLDGNMQEAHGPMCANTEGAPGLPLAGRRLQPVGAQAQDDAGELWVLGDIFLKKYAVLLDFENRLIGLAQPIRTPPPPGQAAGASAAGATVEAMQDIQRYEDASTEVSPSEGEHVRGAVSHFLEVAGRSKEKEDVVGHTFLPAALVSAACLGVLGLVICRSTTRVNLSPFMRDAERELEPDAGLPSGSRWADDETALAE